MLRHCSFGVSILALLIFAAFFGQNASAQQFFLSPDTVTVCSEEPEVFTLELRADENVTNLSLYHVALGFDPDLLELYFVNDTSWWICNGYQVDSTCIDSVATAWDLDSLCLGYDCSHWEHVDSTCFDSTPIAWDVDSTCVEWAVIWDVDSLCLDSQVVEWLVDSTCLNWECIEYDIYNDCIDSVCLEWQIDSLPLEYACNYWQVDSTFIDSVCLIFDVDSIPTAYGCTDWVIDSICVDSVCGNWFVDSTATAWECAAYFLDSICYDSFETEDPGSADFFTYKMTEIPVHDSGSLFQEDPEAQSIQFFSRLTSDTSKLLIESLIFWPTGVAVDGPGLLATIKLRNKSPGTFTMTIDSLVAHDLLGNDLPVTAGEGSVLLLNPPSDSFNLKLPSIGQLIEAAIDDSVELVWESSQVFCPGDSILYTLTVSDIATFNSLNTYTFEDLQDTVYSFDATYDLWYGNVFWKVTATNVLGLERLCTPDYSYFDLQLEATAPGDFNLMSPDDSSLFNTIARITQDFAWTIPSSQVPDDTLSYDVHFWLGAPVPGGEDFIVTGLDSNGTGVAIDQFQLYNDYSWRVNCSNRIGLSNWSTQVFVLSYFLRGDANSDGEINIGDAVFIINYIFKGGPPPAFEKLGDPNCDLTINVGDPVYLINYIFKGGPAPCPDD